MIVSSKRSTQDWLLLIGLFCFFFSGAAGLVYQVVWTRMLTQIFGNTTYAIATVLSAFIAARTTSYCTVCSKLAWVFMASPSPGCLP